MSHASSPLSQREIEKAQQAIQVLSSLVVNEVDRSRSCPGPSTSRSVDADLAGPSEISGHGTVTQAADNAIQALQRMRDGMRSSYPKATNKRARDELSNMFNTKKKKNYKIAWRHKFVCLAYRDQEKVPSTDCEKEELWQAGLGERVIEFPTLNMTQKEFKDCLIKTFPQLSDCGGFQLLKGIANSRKMEVLSMAVHASPALLKERVGTSRTYIRPIQKDLDVNAIKEEKHDEVVCMEKCLTCGLDIPLNDLPNHMQLCQTVDLTKEPSPEPSLKFEPYSPNYPYSPRYSYSPSYCDHDDGVNLPFADFLFNETVLEKTDEISNNQEKEVPQSVIEESFKLETISIEKISSCSEAVKYLQRLTSLVDDDLVDEHSINHIEVRRDFVVKDALKQAKKQKFSPKKLLKVTFLFESAVDLGGPRREFFRLLSHSAKDMLFIGQDHFKFFCAVQGRDLYYLGIYIAISIIQGGNGFPFLAEPVYSYMCTGTATGIEILTKDIPDPTLLYVVEKLDEASTDDDIKVLFAMDEATTMLIDAGFRKPINKLTLNDRSDLKSALVDHHCMLKVKGYMDQFIEGLDALGVMSVIRKYPQAMKPLFVYDIRTLPTPGSLKDLVHVNVSEKGSNSRMKEEQAWMHFCDFIDECEEGKTGCTLGEVLAFFTASDCIPPGGFPFQPSVSFIKESHLILCTSSTCDGILRLPTTHGEDYEAFRNAMIMSIKENDGFGGP